MTGKDLCPFAGLWRQLGFIAHHAEQLVVGGDGIIGFDIRRAVSQILRRVGDACKLAGGNHCLDLFLVGLPVLEEDAGRARHGEHVGIGSQGVLLQRILSVIGAFLSIVVLNEGDSILAVGSILEIGADKGPVAVILLAQFLPVTSVAGIADGVTELEVEGGAGLLCAVNPVTDGVRAVPALTDGELRLAVFVVHLGICRAVALHHVVTEADIAEIVEQELEVGLDDALHVLTLVVEVTHAGPVIAGVFVFAEAIAVGCGPFLGLAAIVVGADVGGEHLVVLTVIGFLGEVNPIGDIAAVVDDDIGDGAESEGLEGLDHRTQLGFVAEGAVVVVEPPEVVVAHGLCAAVAALGNPDEVEGAGEVIGLLFEERPAGIFVGVPIESL